MSKNESRRRVPASAVAITAFALLIIFEGLVIGGIIGVKASTVARIAPWAYEPFLKLVGEHPESKARKGSGDAQQADEAGAPSGMASAAGFDPDGLVIDLGVEIEEDGGDVAPKAVLPDKNPSNTVPAGSSSTNPVPDRPKEVVPVG